MTRNELEKLLVINRTNLDEEVCRQADIYFKVSEACTEAVSIRDTLKEAVATADAKIDNLIRNLETGKMTEAQVKHAIQVHPEHAEAFAKYLEAKKEADSWDNLKGAFEQRHFLLGYLAKLSMSNFFERSSISAETLYDKQRDKLAKMRELIS